MRRSYFDKQTNLGFVYRFDVPHPEYGDPLYKSPSNNGKQNYYYQVPVMEQYGRWLKNIVTNWDWGVSRYIQPNVSAGVIIGNRLPTSIKINILNDIGNFSSNSVE